MFAVDARSCMLSHDRSTSLSLLEQARNRDETAWGRLVDLDSPMVVHWCNTSGVRAPDSDDLVQDVFQAVFKNLDGFRRDRKGDTFRGWLRSITRFKVQDYYRRRAAEPAAQGGTDARLRLERLTEAELGEDTPEDLGALYRRALELVRGEFEDAPGRPSGGPRSRISPRRTSPRISGSLPARCERPSARLAPASPGSRRFHRLSPHRRGSTSPCRPTHGTDRQIALFRNAPRLRIRPTPDLARDGPTPQEEYLHCACANAWVIDRTRRPNLHRKSFSNH